MATLMAGHRKMEESKQVRDDLSASQGLQNCSNNPEQGQPPAAAHRSAEERH